MACAQRLDQAVGAVEAQHIERAVREFTIRVTPKISDRPADTRNRDAAAASPFRSWMMMEAKVT